MKKWIFLLLAMALVAFFMMPMAIAHNREGPFTPAEFAFAKTDLTSSITVISIVVAPRDPVGMLAQALAPAIGDKLSHFAVDYAKPGLAITVMTISIVTPTNQGSLVAQAATILEKRMSYEVRTLTFTVETIVIATLEPFTVPSHHQPYGRSHDPTVANELAQGETIIVTPLLTVMTPVSEPSHRPDNFSINSNNLALRTLLSNWRTPSYHQRE